MRVAAWWVGEACRDDQTSGGFPFVQCLALASQATLQKWWPWPPQAPTSRSCFADRWILRARKSRRGAQSRSMAAMRQLLEFLDRGGIGKITVAPRGRGRWRQPPCRTGALLTPFSFYRTAFSPARDSLPMVTATSATPNSVARRSSNAANASDVATPTCRSDRSQSAALLVWQPIKRPSMDREFAGLLDAAAAADMLAWENSGFSVDLSLADTMSFVPMQIHAAERTISQSDHRFAFPLSPTPASVAGPQVDPLPNRQVDRNRLDVPNLADDLKVHRSPNVTQCHPMSPNVTECHRWATARLDGSPTTRTKVVYARPRCISRSLRRALRPRDRSTPQTAPGENWGTNLADRGGDRPGRGSPVWDLNALVKWIWS